MLDSNSHMEEKPNLLGSSKFNIDRVYQLQDVIRVAIDQMSYDTAEFYGELLHAECSLLDKRHYYLPFFEYYYLLALFLNGKPLITLKAAERFIDNNLGACYLYGKCALHLSKHMDKAVTSLLRFINDECDVTDEEANIIGVHLSLPPADPRFKPELIYMPHRPTSATIHCLLGNLYYKLGKTDKSAMHHSKALTFNPYLWESMTALNKMGATIDLKKHNMLLVRKSKILEDELNRNSSSAGSSQNSNISMAATDSSKSRAKPGISGSARVKKTRPYSSNSSLVFTPFKGTNSPPTVKVTNTTSSAFVSGTTPETFPHTLQGRKSLQMYNSIFNHQKNPPSASKTNSTHGGALFSNTANIHSPPGKQTTINSLAKNSNRGKLFSTPPSKLFSSVDNEVYTKRTPHVINNNNTETNEQLGAEDGGVEEFDIIQKLESTDPKTFNLSDINYLFALIAKCCSNYDSYKAIRLFHAYVPDYIVKTMPWCLAQLGKLHYEIVNYEMATDYFMRLSDKQQFRVADTEIFSTLLWHLQDHKKLASLADYLMTYYPNKPETWCCVGNYLSLKKDHEEAIQAFEKATKIDPNFAYAYTLQGHEYSSNDSFDAAKKCFRKALSCDPKHYNAYYGMGIYSMKLGRCDEALLYFEKARQIYPINAVLICCCGVALEKLDYQEKALEYYELACSLQPNSNLARFKRANLLYSMGRYNLALQNFEELVKLTPEEPTVHFVLGQLYQIMGRKNEAIREFTVAMNLDPKGNQLILDALEKCHRQE
ncbi:anaphase promoting complex subunit CDC27 [Nakaseomyces bracarensis]|uniref:anaphase promoting complex subunit CDC27 n=1 Tax=Nakaseomyces bracarensis TaxID=273131 RepID=UPI003871F0B4